MLGELGISQSVESIGSYKIQPMVGQKANSSNNANNSSSAKPGAAAESKNNSPARRDPAGATKKVGPAKTGTRDSLKPTGMDSAWFDEIMDEMPAGEDSMGDLDELSESSTFAGTSPAPAAAVRQLARVPEIAEPAQVKATKKPSGPTVTPSKGTVAQKVQRFSSLSQKEQHALDGKGEGGLAIGSGPTSKDMKQARIAVDAGGGLFRHQEVDADDSDADGTSQQRGRSSVGTESKVSVADVASVEPERVATRPIVKGQGGASPSDGGSSKQFEERIRALQADLQKEQETSVKAVQAAADAERELDRARQETEATEARMRDTGGSMEKLQMAVRRLEKENAGFRTQSAKHEASSVAQGDSNQALERRLATQAAELGQLRQDVRARAPLAFGSAHGFAEPEVPPFVDAHTHSHSPTTFPPHRSLCVRDPLFRPPCRAAERRAVERVGHRKRLGRAGPRKGSGLGARQRNQTAPSRDARPPRKGALEQPRVGIIVA